MVHSSLEIFGETYLYKNEQLFIIYIYIYIYMEMRERESISMQHFFFKLVWLNRTDIASVFFIVDPFNSLYNENWFSVFIADHLLVGQLCTNPKSDRSLLSCLKMTKMFNEWDWRCTAVQLILSTNPSYDNRTIASTIKMQIWITTNNRDVP